MSSEKQSSTKPRRITARGAATRDRIVATAADLMYAQGVEGTTLDDVIEASGTGKSQVYHYFADKSELVEEVVLIQIDRVVSAQEPFFRNLDSMRGLERWRDAVVASTRSRRGAYGCPMGSLASELADKSESARRELETGFSMWEAHLRTGLERMQHSGELVPEAKPDQLAKGLLAALQGGYLLAQARREAESLEVALNMALDYIRSQTRPLTSRSRRRPASTDRTGS